MRIKAEEIVSVLKKEIAAYESDLVMEDVGTVLEVGDGIARIYGLRKAMSGEMLEFENGAFGLALNLEENSIGAVILGDYLSIKEGDNVKLTRRVLSVPCGEQLIGRVVNPLGIPLDNLGPIKTETFRTVEYHAPGIAQRQPVTVPLQTGIKAVDAMIPIGRGQRELIIGDRGTGKTAIAVDTILNQKDTGVICVYVAIGQKASTIAGVVERLKEAGAMDYTIVVSSTASDPAPLQYIAPYSGCAMAEYFMYEDGGDTLCVYDDLTKQAQAYRQLSLLLRRPPGREAYPGDVFYLHSRLLERSCRLSDITDEDGKVVKKRGSLTALPIIETQEGEVSAYIPTNVISITDGQIYLEPNLFFSGIRPAINVGISVSRVGGNAQIKAMKSVAGSLRLDLAQFWELEAFAQLGTELDAATQAKIDRGKRMVEVLKQGQYVPMRVEDQVVILFAGTRGFLDEIEVDQLLEYEEKLTKYIRETHAEIPKIIREEGKISEETELLLKNVVGEFSESFHRGVAPDPRADKGETERKATLAAESAKAEGASAAPKSDGEEKGAEGSETKEKTEEKDAG